MRTSVISVLLTSAALGFAASSAAQNRNHQQSPEAHHHRVLERGEQRMGFNQQTTTHHFVLLPDGGLVRVQANASDDHAGITQIRKHLREIRGKFSAGDFEAPEFIHAQTPPGIPVMQQQKDAIRYSYRAIRDGAELRISSKQAEAVAAIHQFLKFQIADHKTGDPLRVRQ
jgi:hypothetical protein